MLNSYDNSKAPKKEENDHGMDDFVWKKEKNTNSKIKKKSLNSLNFQ